MRLTPLHRKVIGDVIALPLPRMGRCAEVLLGLDYERKYQCIAKAKAYVLLARDRPATIFTEEVGPTLVVPGDETPEAVFRELRTSFERDLQAVLEAAATVSAKEPELIEP